MPTFVPPEAEIDWQPSEAWTPPEYSPENPPPAEIQPRGSARAENVIAGMDQVPAYPSKEDYVSGGAVEDIASGVMKGIGSIVPKTIGQAAKMLTYTPVEETPHALKEAYDLIRGIPVEQAVPESQTLTGFLQRPLSEQAQVLTEQLAPLAMGVAGLRGAIKPRPTLTEKLAPITGEAPPVQEVPTEAVRPEEVTAKPETPTPQEVVSQETGVSAGVQKALDILDTWDKAGDKDPVLSHVIKRTIEQLPSQDLEEAVRIRQGGEPVPEAGQAPVESVSGAEAQTKLPENTEVTIKATTPKGEPLEVKMDAREAEKVLNDRKTALENLIDCLGA